jgi:capsid protein
MGTIDPDQPIEDAEPPEEAFYPGMIINGRAGETMTFGDPKSDAGISDYMRWAGLRVAAGAQSTYERSTGDLSNVNYSSYKAGDLEFQRFIGRLQWLFFIPRLLKRIERTWSTSGYATGIISTRQPKFKWTPPPFGSVDEGKDTKAKSAQVAAGQESLRNVVAERGYDLDELTDEIVADIAMMIEKLTAKGLEALAPSIIAALYGLKQPNTGGNDGGSAPAAG